MRHLIIITGVTHICAPQIPRGATPANRLLHMCETMHLHMCHDSRTRVPGLLHMCPVTPSHVCRTQVKITWIQRQLIHAKRHLMIDSCQETFDSTAYCNWSVISSISNLNRWSSSLGLFCHVPVKRDQWDWDYRLRLNDTPNAIGCTWIMNRLSLQTLSLDSMVTNKL